MVQEAMTKVFVCIVIDAILEAQSQHFRHADANLANPRTAAWFMKPLKRGALLGVAELNSVPIAFVANSELVWAPIPMMPLGVHAKVVTGKV
eukprot:1113275-Pelagomonas_calceolata.AAC.1